MKSRKFILAAGIAMFASLIVSVGVVRRTQIADLLGRRGAVGSHVVFSGERFLSVNADTVLSTVTHSNRVGDDISMSESAGDPQLFFADPTDPRPQESVNERLAQIPTISIDKRHAEHEYLRAYRAIMFHMSRFPWGEDIRSIRVAFVPFLDREGNLVYYAAHVGVELYGGHRWADYEDFWLAGDAASLKTDFLAEAFFAMFKANRTLFEQKALRFFYFEDPDDVPAWLRPAAPRYELPLDPQFTNGEAGAGEALASVAQTGVGDGAPVDDEDEAKRRIVEFWLRLRGFAEHAGGTLYDCAFPRDPTDLPPLPNGFDDFRRFFGGVVDPQPPAAPEAPHGFRQGMFSDPADSVLGPSKRMSRLTAAIRYYDLGDAIPIAADDQMALSQREREHGDVLAAAAVGGGASLQPVPAIPTTTPAAALPTAPVEIPRVTESVRTSPAVGVELDHRASYTTGN